RGLMPFWSAGHAASSSGFAIGLGAQEIGLSNALRPLAAMLWQRPNIGSRVNREVHARFWERADVKFLRATRHQRRSALITVADKCRLYSETDRIAAWTQNDAKCQ